MSRRQAKLVFIEGALQGREFRFVDSIEIGRSTSEEERDDFIRIDDPYISKRHCIVTQSNSGRFLIRDLSRNGTRIDGKRLMPNVEIEIAPQQIISIGKIKIGLTAEEIDPSAHTDDAHSTLVESGLTTVTTLVGDIRGYTALNQRAKAADVYLSMRSVFSDLERMIMDCGGVLKEYQGDAIFAFWEEDPDALGTHALHACDAVLQLEKKVRALAEDPKVWRLRDYPLQMDWALVTGEVVISNFGEDTRRGLSMVGDAVNLAFRLEKLASDETGTIICCQKTRNLARDHFVFKDLGKVQVEGRDGQEQIFALIGRN